MNKNKKGISIRVKLIGIIIPIVMVIILSFFALSKSVVLDVSKGKLQAQSKSYSEKINSWTEQIFGELQVYKDTIESDCFANDDEILEFMKTSENKNPAYPYGIYMGDNMGVYLDGSGWEPGDDWVLIERDWYIDGKDNDKLAFGEPYYDSMTGQVCVSASVRVKYSKAVRVLASDINLDYVSQLMKEIEENGEVEAFLVTGDNKTIIAHPDTEMMALTLDDDKLDSLYGQIGEALDSNESEVFSSGEYLCSLNPIENTNWYLAVYVKEKNVFADMYKMELWMLVIAVLAALVLSFVILRIMNRVVNPVAKVTNVIGQIAEGDFTQNIETTGNDEIARMSRDMQEFIEQMRSTISGIKEMADWLNCHSEENIQISDSLMSSSDEQRQAMTVLSEMISRISNAAEGVNERMEQLAGLIGQAYSEGENADALMKESVVMSQSGKKDMDNINDGMDRVNDSIMTLSEHIEKVGQVINQIGEMVNMIMGIAEETNLLSLNASIEAARAGEIGKGFAVVAEQIGVLATSSSEAADGISKLTEEIRVTVNTAIEHMKDSVEEVKMNVTMVESASATFENLYIKVEETGARVERMIELVGNVNSVADDMAETTAEQMIATEQIVESVKTLDEHTNNVHSESGRVAASAEDLKSESDELINRISKFIID